VAEKEAGRLDGPVLVVAPTSLLHNWRREIARFAPSLRVMELYGQGRRRLWQVSRLADVALTTYTVLIRDEKQLEGRAFPMLVLDEAQAIKNPRSRMHKAAASVQARQRICLTGTPLENNLGELWALFDLLVPGLLGEQEVFRRHYALPIEREGSRDRLQSLRAQVAPYLLRRMKEDVAPELPPKTEIVRPVELRGPQRDLYESLRIAAHADVRRLIQKKGLAASTVSILDALMKLRQVCCDPRLLRLGALSGAPGRALAASRVAGKLGSDVTSDVGSAKADLFFELLGQQLERGRRVLVFSQFTSMLALLAEGLRARRIKHLVLTGATVDRRRPVEAFERREADVFLISLKAGGTGLNLTSADTVIHYDPWWNPAAQAQATDRAYRIGQTKPVFVFRLIVAGSVEEQMLRLQDRKRALADGVFGAAAGGGARWSAEEIDDLFAPLGAGGDAEDGGLGEGARDPGAAVAGGASARGGRGAIELGSAGPPAV
jgi:SNF2 family DNA or RNA helicase